MVVTLVAAAVSVAQGIHHHISRCNAHEGVLNTTGVTRFGQSLHDRRGFSTRELRNIIGMSLLVFCVLMCMTLGTTG